MQLFREFESHGVEPMVVLGRAGSADRIIIRMTVIEPQSAAQAAALFTK